MLRCQASKLLGAVFPQPPGRESPGGGSGRYSEGEPLSSAGVERTPPAAPSPRNLCARAQVSPPERSGRDFCPPWTDAAVGLVSAMKFRAKIMDLACLNHFTRELAGLRGASGECGPCERTGGMRAALRGTDGYRRPSLCSPPARTSFRRVCLTLLAVVCCSTRWLLCFCGMWNRLALGCQLSSETVSLFCFRFEFWCCGLCASQGCWETGRMSAALRYKRDL